MAFLLRSTSLSSIPAWVQFFLIGAFLLFPISSSAKSVCLVLSLGTLLFTPGFLTDLKTLFSTKWCKATLLLFCTALIFCMWSPASFSQKLEVIEKYSKLLYLPILVVGFQNVTTRQFSLLAFLLAMMITSTVSILKFHDYLQAFVINPDNVFRNHIMTSFMVAFAAYISFLYSFRQQNRGRYVYALLGLIFTYQVLFVSGSRTGYIIYLLMMLFLVLQLCTWRQAIAGIMLLGTLFLTSYFTSSVMKIRIDAIGQQIKGYQHNERDTDIGLRLQFHDYAHQLFNKHPILGNGTASFSYYFNKEKPIKFWIWKLLEPHSQYWLVATEFGLVGICILLYFFFSLIQASWNLVEMRPLALALIIPYMIGNLSDSLLFYSGSGYFFIFFMALFLGEGLEIKNKKKHLSFEFIKPERSVDLKPIPVNL